MERALFGGAITGNLPIDAQDMSDVREIPDNQEVFAHKDTDQSVIIEILEYVQETDEQALKTHFEDLASSNDALSSENSCIVEVGQINKEDIALKDCSAAYWLTGQQSISKFKETARNKVNIHMVLYRLPHFTTDILLTFNDPVTVSPDSSSHVAMSTGTVPWNVEDLKNLIHSLTILDTGLFG